MENKNHPYTIDFIGLPGGGKSTVACALLKHLRQKDIAVRGNANLDPITHQISRHEGLLFLLTHPHILVSAATLALTHRSVHLLPALVKYLVTYFMHVSKTRSVFIQEQGVLNMLFTAHAQGQLSIQQVSNIVSDLFHTQKLPSVIIHVMTPPEIAVTRLYAREKNHSLKSSPQEEIITFMHTYNTCAETVLSSIPSLCVLNVYGTHEISDIVEEIYNKIRLGIN